MDELDRDGEPIKAYVVLKEPTGSPGAGRAATHSSSGARGYAPDDLRSHLERLGFYVKRVTPLSIIVEAPRKTFEGVFRGKLRRDDFSEALPIRWRWTDAVRIPDELRERVDTIVFPEPTKLYV